MRISIFTLFASSALLTLAACSGNETSSETQGRTTTSNDIATEARSSEAAADASSSEAEAMPRIGPETAPNLAFEYRYNFRLPDRNIGAVQQEHAEACTMLSAARCEIVDMQFEQNDGYAHAMLSLRLDPSVAFRFGRDAIAAVEKADGELANGTVSGTNAGGAIEESQGRSAMLLAQVERLEKRLAAKGLPAKERASLQDRIEELRKQLDGEQEQRRQGENKLAMTPVQLNYSSDGGVPGFGNENPFANAFEATAGSFGTMVSFVLLIGGVALPWIALILLIMVGIHALRKRTKVASDVAQ